MGPAPRIARSAAFAWFAVVFALAAATLAGCAAAPAPYRAPVLPDQDLLAEAEAALDAAEDADAAALAPHMLREAHRRIATARAVLLRAAADGRALTDEERLSVERLAAEAALDARLALARTQAAAVTAKIRDLRGALDAAEPGTAVPGEQPRAVTAEQPS